MNDEEDDTHNLIEFNMRIHGKRERERETDRQSEVNDVTDGWKTIPDSRCVVCESGGFLSLTYASSSQSSALT